MADDKWNQFRNFMFNELGITKADIRTWVREAVEEQVKQMLNQSHGYFDVNQIVNRQVKERIQGEGWHKDEKLRSEVARALASRLRVTESN